MNANKNKRPLMVSFQQSVARLRELGLVAWGGLCVDEAGLRSRDLAVRLGAPRPWLETLFELITQSNCPSLVLVDPDFSLFLGDRVENQQLFEAFARDRGLRLDVVHTQKPARVGRELAA